MEVQLMVAFDTEELERLKSSSLLKDFVRKQNGGWDHPQWEGFLASIRDLGYTLPSHVIGAELEVEKEFYWKVKLGEISVPEATNPVLEETRTDADCTSRLAAIAPAFLDEPKGPQMPKRDLFDPVMELENSVIHEPSLSEMGRTEEGSRPVRKTSRSEAARVQRRPSPADKESLGRKKAKAEEEDEHPWDNVDFDTLSKEERAEYLKSQLRKKMGEG